jgi:hypothetical protein
MSHYTNPRGNARRLVPILVEVSLPQEEDPPLTGKEQVLSNRYYLRVHRPTIGVEATLVPYKWHIPIGGITSGVARVLLPPSVGYGYNASYRVEYVAWRPILNSVLVKGRPRIRVPEVVVKEEYWKVPQRSNIIINLEKVHLQDRDSVPSAIIDPISVRALDGRPLEWDIVEHVLDGAYDKSLRDISIWVGDLPIGERYVIEYVAPLTLRDVLLTQSSRLQDTSICRESSLCCPPLVAPWHITSGTQAISTPWFY